MFTLKSIIRFQQSAIFEHFWSIAHAEAHGLLSTASLNSAYSRIMYPSGLDGRLLFRC